VSVLKADYFDGKTSTRRPVSVMLAGGMLKVVGRDVSQEFDARGVRRSLRIANTPRWLYLPGGGACVTLDNDAVDRMTKDRRYEAVLHRWESRPSLAAVAVLMLVFSLWLLFDRALPVAVEAIAERIPVEAEAALGEESLRGMDKYLFVTSTLPFERQATIEDKFRELAGHAAENTPFRLEFRGSPAIGANAFALPSGIILLTDELVRASINDREVLGVLAHELGHVRHRHTMRTLLEGSVTALIIAAVTGDIASAASLAAAAPAVLLQAKYSRDAEREADAYAIRLMRQAGIDPRNLTALLTRLDSGETSRMGVPRFLTSHPSTEERRALAAQGIPPDVPEDVADERSASQTSPHGAKVTIVDPLQWSVMMKLGVRDFDELERILGGAQEEFERRPDNTQRLENAFSVFGKLGEGSAADLDEWARRRSSSYAARVARAMFHYRQGMEIGDVAGSEGVKGRAMRAHLDKARKDLVHSLTLSGKPYMSQLLLISVSARLGDRQAAASHYAEAVKLAPASVEARLARMRSLEPRRGGSYKEMERFVAETRGQLKDAGAIQVAARVPAYRGYELARKKNFGEAVARYDEAVALYPAPDILCERSRALSGLKRDADAFADVKLALSKAPDLRSCLDRAAEVAGAAPDPDQAIALLTLVIDVDVRSGAALNRRGFLHQRSGRMEQAFLDFKASAGRGDSMGQYELAKLYWAGSGVKEDRNEAVFWFRKSAAQGNTEAKASLGNALRVIAERK
jgi:Zn-dependent protease with chaperone function/TPR repeat protein